MISPIQKAPLPDQTPRTRARASTLSGGSSLESPGALLQSLGLPIELVLETRIVVSEREMIDHVRRVHCQQE